MCPKYTLQSARRMMEIGAVGALFALIAALIYFLAIPTAKEVTIAGYATTLDGRTSSQRFNAIKAAQALDGAVVPPGAMFSFNKTVKSWSFDQGYVKAPVSYDGELIRAYGGGVCQTSTTLYNAALLAGLPIVERHSHVFAPHYVPPGRDAAVAQQTIDLRFRNPYKWPIRLHAVVHGDNLEVRITGMGKLVEKAEIETTILSKTEPINLTRNVEIDPNEASHLYLRNPGATGYRVITYRRFTRSDQPVRRERLSDDTYEAMNRVLGFGR